MTDEERHIQTALGNLEKYQVTVTVPVKATVTLSVDVMAVNADDAVARAQLIHEITPDDALLKKAMRNVSEYNSTAAFDKTSPRTYTSGEPDDSAKPGTTSAPRF